MYGKEWIEHLEREAVREKLNAFKASLEPDERVLLDGILREEYRYYDDQQRCMEAIANARMNDMRDMQGCAFADSPLLGLAGGSGLASVLGWR